MIKVFYKESVGIIVAAEVGSNSWVISELTDDSSYQDITDLFLSGYDMINMTLGFRFDEDNRRIVDRIKSRELPGCDFKPPFMSGGNLRTAMWGW